jgi:hypothetical protein
MLQWNLGQYLTIDEMMVRYKGSYCPARQYMPKKPEKWGMKIWCLVDSVTRFVYKIRVWMIQNHIKERENKGNALWRVYWMG